MNNILSTDEDIAAPALGASSPSPLPRVLVVDDEPRNLLAVSEILSGPGMELVLVESGEDALRRILREEFAVILLDVRMPRMDGYEAASMIRARRHTSHIPILFMTAYNKDELHVFRGYSAGAVDYVFKPIEPIVLRCKVEVFVDLYRKTEEIKRQHAAEKRLLLENLRVRNEKLAMEQALRRGEEHQALILRGLPVALYTTSPNDVHRKLRFTSDNVERIWGYEQELFETPGFWKSCVDPEDLSRVLAEFALLETRGTITAEYRLHCKDGSQRHILDHAVLSRDTEDRPQEVFGIWFDVSDRKELERRLLHASKMEAVGRLTGGVAHDFNNMLGVVVGNLDLLSRTGNGETASRYLNGALQAAQRCADLTNQLLAFSRQSPLQPAVIQPERILPGIIEMLERTLGERIDVQVSAVGPVPSIRVDRSQFEAALVNLAVNARDAMPGGGVLRIELRSLLEHPSVESEHGCVEILVADNGVGMPPAILERVFEPFFTTKERGKGTGLGLSMVYGFVQQSGGIVLIESSAGEGTSVRLIFPATHDQSAFYVGDVSDESVQSGAGETILVVEDEAVVREAAKASLETLGYTVVQAANAEEALDILEARAICLIFSDVRMPGSLNGIDLARLSARRWSDTPVLLVSGFIEEQDDIGGFPILRKPYTLLELADKVAQLLRPGLTAPSSNRT